MAINAEDFDGLDDYCDALRRQESLTPVEFSYILQQSIAWGEESKMECSTQYRSECAMFGDAGPGQYAALVDTSRLLADDRARLARVSRIIANLAA